MKIDEIKTEHKSNLEMKMQNNIKFPEAHFNWFKGAIISVCLGVLAIGGLNYKLHNGPQKHEYKTYTECFAKPTGLFSYAEYRKFEFYEENAEKKLEKKCSDVITKSIFLIGSEVYVDENNDKKVDKISVEGRPIFRLLKREADYDQYKQKFDEADKFFAKYIDLLKLKRGIK